MADWKQRHRDRLNDGICTYASLNITVRRKHAARQNAKRRMGKIAHCKDQILIRHETESIESICESLGISPKTGRKYALEIGIVSWKRQVKDMRPMMVELNSLGYSSTDISKILGVSSTAVCDYFRNAGIQHVGWGILQRARQRDYAKNGKYVDRLAKQNVELHRRLGAEFSTKSGWPENLRPRETAIMNVLATLGLPATKHEIRQCHPISKFYLQQILESLWRHNLVVILRGLRRGNTSCYALSMFALSLLENRCEQEKGNSDYQPDSSTGRPVSANISNGSIAP